MKDIQNVIFRYKGPEAFRIKDGATIIIDGKMCTVTYIDKDSFVVKEEVDRQAMTAQETTIKALKEKGFIVSVAEWDMKLGKGPDDLFANGHKPQYVLA